MSSTPCHLELWSIIRGTPQIDPYDLLLAIEQECRRPALDFRTRLLIRDSALALALHWGRDNLDARLTPEAREIVTQVEAEPLGEPGFPSLGGKLMEATSPQTILDFFRELGTELQQPARLDVGGSSALILRGLLKRSTEDIDAVDQVPDVLRTQYNLLATLASRYSLHLNHFQSHFLPAGWSARLQSLGRFGMLDVFLVDAYDIFVGKLFSRRDKDRDDLRVLRSSLEKQQITDRLLTAGASFLNDAKLRVDAERNWYIVFGEALPAS